MPRFHVRDAFALQDKKSFVLAGFTIEGEVAAGMLVQIPFTATVMTTAEIDHVQFIRRPDGDLVCLFIRCADPEEVTLWEALKIKDRTVDITTAA